MLPYRLVPLLILLLASLLPLTAAAADRAYQVQVAVPDQSADARAAGLQRALADVLQRLTGRDEAARAPALQEVRAQPERYVRSYRYESGATGELLLTVTFDGASLRQAVGQRGVAVWSANRPPVLVWLAFEREGQRALVGADEAPDLRDELLQAAQTRGVSLLFPLLDVEDRQRVKFSDVWGGFEEPVIAASQRYGTAAVLVGRLHRGSAGDWVVRWRFIDGRSEGGWETAGAQLPGVLQRSVAELSTRLGTQYSGAPMTALGDRLRVRVEGVDGLRAFSALSRYLAAVAGVAAAQPISVDGDRVVFELKTDLDPRGVARTLDNGGRLAPMTVGGVGDPYAAPEYQYRFVQ